MLDISFQVLLYNIYFANLLAVIWGKWYLKYIYDGSSNIHQQIIE